MSNLLSKKRYIFQGDCIRLLEFPKLLDILAFMHIFLEKSGYLLHIVSVNPLEQFKKSIFEVKKATFNKKMQKD